MLIPVRCFSCGTPIAQYWEEYKEKVAKGEEADKVLDAIGVKRYCCRRMFLSHEDLIEDIMPYKRF